MQKNDNTVHIKLTCISNAIKALAMSSRVADRLPRIGSLQRVVTLAGDYIEGLKSQVCHVNFMRTVL